LKNCACTANNNYLFSYSKMNNEKNTKWDYEAPKFWDLSETIVQDRPSESWFCKLC
jgi:hypothetical protein